MRPPLTFDTREEWLEARRTLGVGSSEVSALFSKPENPLRGLSSWASPLSLNYEKRGITHRDDEDNPNLDRLEWGLQMEPLIADWFDRKVREEVEPLTEMRDPGRFTVILPEPGDATPWFASVDRLIYPLGAPDDSNPKAVVEIKNASAFIANEWDEEPPLPYQLQVQQQMAVMGLKHAYICASIGGQSPKWAKVKRNDAVIQIMRERVTAFWHSVTSEYDPPADAANPTALALLSRWPQANGGDVVLDTGAEIEWRRRQELHEQAKNLTLEKDAITNGLKQRIGPHSFGLLPGGTRLSLIENKAGHRNLKEVDG